jgi:hypothetical protein
MAARTLSAVLPVLATDWLPWIVGICIVSMIVLLLIIVAPWRGVRREPPLDRDVEARLLLGEDPDEIDRDLAQRDAQRRAPVTDLHPDDDAEGDLDF